MSESVKTVLTLSFVGAVLVAAIAWWDDQPNEVVWMVRIGCSLLALVLFLALVRKRPPQDLATDYLAVFSPRYFNRDGFCFDVGVNSEDGVCYVIISYQSQYAKRSEGRIAIRPASGYWMSRPQFVSICVELAINPGEHGVLRLPVPVSTKMQGKTLTFELAASVCYPDGKGERLRFSEGQILRDNQEFSDSFHTEIIPPDAAAEKLELTNVATIQVQLPLGVATELSGAETIERETLRTYVSE